MFAFAITSIMMRLEMAILRDPWLLTGWDSSQVIPTTETSHGVGSTHNMSTRRRERWCQPHQCKGDTIATTHLWSKPQTQTWIQACLQSMAKGQGLIHHVIHKLIQDEWMKRVFMDVCGLDLCPWSQHEYKVARESTLLRHKTKCSHTLQLVLKPLNLFPP